jgi:hypothetical protein
MIEMNSNLFAYHVIRYLPNHIRNEWVNIGVVIHDSVTEKFRVRLIEEDAEYARVRRLHRAADEATLRRYNSMLDDSLSRHDGTLTEWIAKLDRSLSSAVEFSPRTALRADDLDVELDRLYGSIVALPRAHAAAGVAETRSGIRNGANQVFRIAGLWPKLERSVRVDKFTYSGDPLRLDFSYRRNGTQGFIHSLALTRDPAQAKVLAYTADAIRGKFAKTEFVAITEIEPHPEANDRHKFVTGLFEKENIQIVPLSKLPMWAHQMRPQVH